MAKSKDEALECLLEKVREAWESEPSFKQAASKKAHDDHECGEDLKEKILETAEAACLACCKAHCTAHCAGCYEDEE